MKQRLVHFRTRPRQEDKPSVIRRVARVAVPLAAVGGVYAYLHHYSRPKNAPIPNNNPGGKYDASRKLAASGGTPVVSAKVNEVLASATKHIGGSMTADDLAGTVPLAPKASAPAPAPVAPVAPATPAVSKVPKSRPATNPPGHRALALDKPTPKPATKKPKVLDRRDPRVMEMIKRHNGWTKAPKEASARLPLVNFNNQDWANGNRMGTPDGVMTAVRKGQRIVPWVNRSGEVAGDLGDMASGKKVKDPFFKKTWFKRAMQGAAIAAPILASRKLSKYHRQAEEAKSGLGAPLSGYRLKALTLAKEWLPDTVYKHAVERPMFDAKVKNLILLEALARHVDFMKVVGGGYRPPVRLPMPKGVDHLALYVAPEWVKPNVDEGVFHVPENKLPTATKRGAILQRPVKDSGGSGGFFGKQGVEKNALSHELVHSIQRHRLGPISSKLDLILREAGAYRRTLFGKNAKRKMEGGASLPVRAIQGVVGTVRSSKAGLEANPGLNLFSTKVANQILLHAVEEHLTQFDYTSDQRGWDLRDARGRSARVYAPGSRRRERREKEWGEKTDNIRMVRNAALLAAAAGLGGAVYYRSKVKKLTPGAKLGPEIKPGQVLTPMAKFDPSLLKNASARVRLTHFSRSDRRPTLDRVLAAANEHAIDPAVDALVPTVPDSVKSGASRMADDMTRGVLENAGYGAFRTLKRGAIAGTLLGGGALLGHLKRKPRLGLAGGSLAAGMYLGKSS